MLCQGREDKVSESTQLTIGEAAEICLKFRHDRNSDQCICVYLAEAAEIEANKKAPWPPVVVYPDEYIRTRMPKNWKKK